jgi:hypothetical protein
MRAACGQAMIVGLAVSGLCYLYGKGASLAAAGIATTATLAFAIVRQLWARRSTLRR